MLATAAGSSRFESCRARRQRLRPARCAAALRALKPGIERLDYGLAMSTADNWLGTPRPPVRAASHLGSAAAAQPAAVRRSGTAGADAARAPRRRQRRSRATYSSRARSSRLSTRARSKSRCAARRREAAAASGRALRSMARSTHAALSSCRRRAVTVAAPTVEGEGSASRARVRAASGRQSVARRCCSPI